MKDSIRQMGTTCPILTLVLFTALTACGTGGETETPDAVEGPAAAMGATDTTHVRETYDQIGRHYQEMMRRFEATSGLTKITQTLPCTGTAVYSTLLIRST